MSAPATHDPLVVNTADGAVWQRRAVTSDGRGLYAVAGSCDCPEFVMATLAELAEHGIVGSADALPVPVGAEPSPRSILDLARNALRARMAKDDLRLVLENTITYAAELERQRDAFRDQRNNVFATNERLHAEVAEADQARLRAENETRTVRREADTLRSRVAELEAAQGTAYRASHDSIVMGTYTNRAAAREHCETELRRELGDEGFLGWVPDDGSDLAPEELSVFGPGEDEDGPEETCTGYTITPLEIASAYDPDADE